MLSINENANRELSRSSYYGLTFCLSFGHPVQTKHRIGISYLWSTLFRVVIHMQCTRIAVASARWRFVFEVKNNGRFTL